MMNIPICPKCNKPTKRMSGSVETTFNYYPPVYDEKNVNINPNQNVTTTEWECLNYGHTWKVKNQ